MGFVGYAGSVVVASARRCCAHGICGCTSIDLHTGFVMHEGTAGPKRMASYPGPETQKVQAFKVVGSGPPRFS
eukprot:4903139-Pyramimonas_sp.AAC.1